MSATQEAAAAAAAAAPPMPWQDYGYDLGTSVADNVGNGGEGKSGVSTSTSQSGEWLTASVEGAMMEIQAKLNAISARREGIKASALSSRAADREVSAAVAEAEAAAEAMRAEESSKLGLGAGKAFNAGFGVKIPIGIFNGVEENDMNANNCNYGNTRNSYVPSDLGASTAGRADAIAGALALAGAPPHAAATDAAADAAARAAASLTRAVCAPQPSRVSLFAMLVCVCVCVCCSSLPSSHPSIDLSIDLSLLAPSLAGDERFLRQRKRS